MFTMLKIYPADECRIELKYGNLNVDPHKSTLSLKISSEGPESNDILVQAYTNMDNVYGTYHNDTEMRQKLWDYLESNYADDFFRAPPSHMPNGDINLHHN
uniref:Uncharacterized protein n=1 Tax=Glossina pallidipes TaxID=7398 RepID=A0A1A9ZN55_GLOPL